MPHLLAQENMEGLEGIAPTTQVAAPQQAEEDQPTAQIRCSGEHSRSPVVVSVARRVTGMQGAVNVV